MGDFFTFPNFSSSIHSFNSAKALTRSHQYLKRKIIYYQARLNNISFLWLLKVRTIFLRILEFADILKKSRKKAIKEICRKSTWQQFFKASGAFCYWTWITSPGYFIPICNLGSHAITKLETFLLCNIFLNFAKIMLCLVK